MHRKNHAFYVHDNSNSINLKRKITLIFIVLLQEGRDRKLMPVSNKLTLFVLVLPSFFLVAVFGVGFYFYRNSFDALVFSTAVSSLTSAIVVILLVWERLRDSLFKKLGYLQRNILSELSRVHT